MYTAAEALRKSDCGQIKDKSIGDNYQYDEDLKVWRIFNVTSQMFEISSDNNHVFSCNGWLPVMAEKSELEKAKEKYLGKWCRIMIHLNTDWAFIARRVFVDTDNLIKVGSTNSAYTLKEIELLELEPSIPTITKHELMDFVNRCECIDEMPEDYKLGYDTACRYISYYIETIDFKLEPSNLWPKGRCCLEDAPIVTKDTEFLIWLDSDSQFLTIQRYFNTIDNDWVWELIKAKKGDLWWPLPGVEG